MMESKTEGWDSYYSRTLALPSTTACENFLSHIPHGGRVLDFGAGSGRWAAAFQRDRPDIVIDVLDRNIDKASLLSEIWAGEKIHSSFEDYTATKRYDGIWSFACLFFLKREAMEQCFHALANSLVPQGIFSFTMVEDGPAAEALKFHGLSKADLLEILRKEGLDVVRLHYDETIRYGVEGTAAPTFFVRARKL